MTPQQVASRLRTDPVHGLENTDSRQAVFGANEIERGQSRSVLAMIAEQFRDFMIIVLLAAAVISGLVGELIDTIAILVIVLLNAIIGATQEYRAEKAMEALRRMATPVTRVIRAGRLQDAPTASLVPGDVVVLEAGDQVPADLRLIDTSGLSLDEAALTGESEPVDKTDAALSEPDPPLGDRYNMAYKSTLVTRGRGHGLVVATGMSTEQGRIARLIGGAEQMDTPLQRRLARFGRKLAMAILVICAMVMAGGLLRGEAPILMLLTAVSLAVAAIPEALPAVVSISLAFGARRMSDYNALVRRLTAVETLGSVTYICSDKTGTLTCNRMHAELLYCAGEELPELPSDATGAARWLALAMALSNNVVRDDEGNAAGDPTEIALFEAAEHAGYEPTRLAQDYPGFGEFPFDSTRKRMTTLHRFGESVVAFTKGAPEKVIPLCVDHAAASAGVVATAFDAKAMLAEAERLAGQGYRVLALAMRELESASTDVDAEHIEQSLTFLGFAALIDPPRPEVPDAVKHCRDAGIVPVMITGDHPQTARTVALRLGIINDGEGVLSGQELAAMTDVEFHQAVAEVRVYARVTPEQKINIVQALQQRGEVVAMTGDGVNDAPALKHAEIGVAMGQKGTEVAREAADMVLLDDNFATIVAAVHAGRRIFDNIRKFIRYTMTSNCGEIWTVFLAPFLGLPIPLLPIQILWINLVTDGLPGLALTAERGEAGLMHRPPRPPNESVFAHGLWQHILWVGLLIGGLSLGSQAWALSSGSEAWQTVVFTTLTFCQLAHVLVIRSERESLLGIGVFSNPALIGAVLLTVVLQLLIIYVPMFNPVFKTQPLNATELAVCFTLPVVVILMVEGEKWLTRRGFFYREKTNR